MIPRIGDAKMLRSLCFPLLIAVALAVMGCGSNDTEIPATKQATPAPTQQESAAKAMQGMPAEYRARAERAKQGR